MGKADALERQSQWNVLYSGLDWGSEREKYPEYEKWLEEKVVGGMVPGLTANDVAIGGCPPGCI